MLSALFGNGAGFGHVFKLPFASFCKRLNPLRALLFFSKTPFLSLLPPFVTPSHPSAHPLPFSPKVLCLLPRASRPFLNNIRDIRIFRTRACFFEIKFSVKTKIFEKTPENLLEKVYNVKKSEAVISLAVRGFLPNLRTKKTRKNKNLKKEVDFKKCLMYIRKRNRKPKQRDGKRRFYTAKEEKNKKLDFQKCR